MFQLHIQGRDNVAFKIGNQTVLDTNGLGGIQLDSDDGALTTSSTFDSRDVAADGVTADAALPRTGGIMTGVISGFESTGIDDNATSTAITIDVNDNVGIGVTPEAWSTTGVVQVGRVSLTGTPSAIGGSLNWNAYYNSGWKYKDSLQAGSMTLDNGIFTFKVAPSGSADAAISWKTAMAINNVGEIEFGSSSDVNQQALRGLSYDKQVMLSSRNGTDGHISMFYKGGTFVGSIQVNGSSTIYATSSDYRLKENVTPMSGATARVKLLKPCNFDWISTGENVDGFLAHEAQEVVPEAASGTKDAMMDEEYEVTPAVMDGETVVTEAVMGTRSVPDLQGIDQSKLVPLLTATIQELIARIEALEAG